MSDPIEQGYEEVVKIPSGVMGLVRKSYDTREKILDWMLAIAVVSVLVYLFHDKIKFPLRPSTYNVNLGKQDMVPTQDAEEALKTEHATKNVYTYNMPASRAIKEHIGPSGVRIPFNPKFGGQFAVEYEEQVGIAWKGDERR